MHLLAALQNPAFIAILALVLAVVWMLRDETDKTRPLLVIALTVNLFYGFFLTLFMGREGALLPWKYDHVLYRIDAALGLPAYVIAQPLQVRRREADRIEAPDRCQAEAYRRRTQIVAAGCRVLHDHPDADQADEIPVHLCRGDAGALRERRERLCFARGEQRLQNGERGFDRVNAAVPARQRYFSIGSRTLGYVAISVFWYLPSTFSTRRM